MKLVKPSIAITSSPRTMLRRITTFLALTLACAISARAAEAPPHNISAINLNVVQNDTGNTEASVTVSPVLSINDMRVRIGSSRGDFNVMVGDSGTNDLAPGMVMVAINQNGRYNLDEQSEPFYGAPAFDGNANGYWAVLQDSTSDRAEYNVNCAVGYFRYTNWFCGWARNATAANGGTNNLFTGSPGLILGNQFKGISNGRSRVDLRSFGIYSTNSFATNTGVLLSNHAKNEGNYSVTVANPDGTWEILVKDNFGNTNAVEQDPVAFVFIPKTNTTVVSGKFGLAANGTDAVIYLHSGNTPGFAITNIATGRYRLTIPGGSPAAGVLLVTPDAAGFAAIFPSLDNAVSYEADGDGWIIESRDLGVYPPVLEACTNEPVASFVYIPAATAGFTVTPTNTLTTSEFGLTAQFNVQLDLAPTNDVTIDVTSSNPAEGTVSASSLTFNSTNWNIVQSVTITGQNDALSDGNIAYSIVLAPNTSGDTNYLGLNPPDVSVINVDDEQASVAVSPVNGLVTTEAGGTATISVFLSRAPTANVDIGFSSSNTAEGTVSPPTLTFTTSDWNTPKTVTVTGANDFKQDGNKAYSIITAPATSTDLSFNGVDPVNPAAINLDNDTAGYVWNYVLPVSVIEGATATYTLALGTQPDSNVVVTSTSLNLGAATVSPATMTFTPANWSTPQVITLTGVDNLTNNPAVSFTVNHQPASTDPVYSQLSSVIPVPAVLIDNEAQFSLPSGDCIYGLGMPAIGIDGQAAVTDVDAAPYNGGSVTASLVANAQPGDRLEIRNTGTNSGQISVSGANVSYGGTVIGTFTGGAGATPLAVSFNANASVTAVQQMIRSITFRTATNALLMTRTLSVNLNDGLGFNGTASKAVRVGDLRHTQYQEGNDNGYGNYFGAADIALSEVGNGTPWPLGRTRAPQEGLLIDWPDGGTPNESQVLLRFDDFVGTNYWQVPSNAIVVSAELQINVNNTGDGGRLFRMLIPWDATNATWSSTGDGIQADDVEARSVYDSQVGVEDGSGATTVGMITIGVTTDVQAWVSGQTNYGWVMKGWPLQTDGTGFTPSDYAAVPAERPRLRVKWLVPNSGYASVSLQQGVNGYANTLDANLSQQNPDVNNAAAVSIGSDANDAGATNNTQGLLRFDNLIGTDTNQIPPGAVIHSAILELASVGPDGMGDGGQFYALLQPWDVATTTWNTWTNGVQADGIEAALTPTAVAGNSSLNPDVQGTFNYYEVTTDVQAWAYGTRTNYGWVIIPWLGGANGWFSRSSEAVSLVDPLKPEAERPRLRVYYSVNVPGSPAVIRQPVASATQVQIPFLGSPSKTYSVWRSGTVTGTYTPIGTATVAGNGQATFTDNSPLPQAAFYKVVYP